jgi:hypothetical protein
MLKYISSLYWPGLRLASKLRYLLSW